MARQYGKSNTQVLRNLQSAGRTAAKLTGRTSGKAAVGLSRWATTDHTGIGRSLLNMPSMGFVDSIRYIIMHFILSVLGAGLTGILVFLLIAYGIPFLFFG